MIIQKRREQGAGRLKEQESRRAGEPAMGEVAYDSTATPGSPLPATRSRATEGILPELTP